MDNDRRSTKKELPHGANPLWKTIAAILNTLIFAGFGYMLWEA